MTENSEKVDMYDFPAHDYTQEQNGSPYFSSIVRQCKSPSLSRRLLWSTNFATMVTWCHTSLYILLKRLDSRFSICCTALDWFRSYLTNHTQFALIDRKNHNLVNSNVACLKALSLDPYCTYFIQHYWLTFYVIIRCHSISSLMIFIHSFSLNNDLELASTIAKIQDCLSDLDRWVSLNKLHPWRPRGR